MNFVVLLRILLALIVFGGFFFRYLTVLVHKASPRQGRLLTAGLVSLVIYVGAVLVSIDQISFGSFGFSAIETILTFAILELVLKRFAVARHVINS